METMGLILVLAGSAVLGFFLMDRVGRFLDGCEIQKEEFRLQDETEKEEKV